MLIIQLISAIFTWPNRIFKILFLFTEISGVVEILHRMPSFVHLWVYAWVALNFFMLNGVSFGFNDVIWGFSRRLLPIWWNGLALLVTTLSIDNVLSYFFLDLNVVRNHLRFLVYILKNKDICVRMFYPVIALRSAKFSEIITYL